MNKLLSMIIVRVSAAILVLAAGGYQFDERALGAERSYTNGAFHGCLMQAHRVVHITSPVQGRLISVRVERGAEVAKGAVIAELESSVERADVEVARARAENNSRLRSAQAKLTYLNSQLQRKIKLWKKDLMPLAVVEETLKNRNLAAIEVDDALAELKLAKIQLSQAQQRLDRRVIRSPIKGVIVDRFLSAGERIEVQTPVVRIARLDLLTVQTFVPIAFYGSIEEGAVAEVWPIAPIGGRFKAVVKSVDRMLDGASQTFQVQLELRNPQLRIPAETRCRLVFVQRPSTATSDARQPVLLREVVEI